MFLLKTILKNKIWKSNDLAPLKNKLTSNPYLLPLILINLPS